MKKLLTIGLLMLSSVTFAETVKPDLLVGKWQCEDQGFLFNNTMHITETSIRKYKSDGTHSFEYSQTEATEVRPNIWFPIRKKVKGIGKWKVSNDILTLNVTNVLEYQSTPKVPSLEEKYRKDKAFYDLQFQEFSKDNFMLIYPEKIADKLDGNIIENCERMK